jgi:hypothetical protein
MFVICRFFFAVVILIFYLVVVLKILKIITSKKEMLRMDFLGSNLTKKSFSRQKIKQFKEKN